jgi:hypothetical protein
MVNCAFYGIDHSKDVNRDDIGSEGLDKED